MICSGIVAMHTISTPKTPKETLEKSEKSKLIQSLNLRFKQKNENIFSHLYWSKRKMEESTKSF